MRDIITLSDEQLAELVRSEDQELFREIISRYKTKLANYLRKFISSPDELEDVLQDVFIKSFRNLFSFDTAKKFSPWIYRIAHNEAINHVKKRRHLSLDEHDWEIFDEKSDFKKDLDTEILRTQLQNALANIKEKYREPLILYYFEEKSYDEIAEIMQLPKNTIGTLLSRAKKQMQKYLKKN